MKKMLIVGGAGFIGGYMTDVFEHRSDYSVTVYDNLLYETRFLKQVSFVRGDIRDAEKLKSVIDDFDVVVWLAALVGDGACAVEPNISEEINYNAVKWLVDNYKGTIVFMSTCSVYGINSDLLDECAATHPLSVYADTKLRAEQYVIEHAEDYLIFRLGTLYGLGDTYSRLRYDLVVNVLTLRAVLGLPLMVYGGQQWRPILHVRDVAHAVEYCLDQNVRGLYNLSEQNVEISSLAKEISKQVENTKVIQQDMKFEDLRDYKVKNDRILAAGWKPRFNPQEGISEMIRVFKEGRVTNFDDPVYSNVAFLKANDFWKKSWS